MLGKYWADLVALHAALFRPRNTYCLATIHSGHPAEKEIVACYVVVMEVLLS